MHMKEGSGG